MSAIVFVLHEQARPQTSSLEPIAKESKSELQEELPLWRDSQEEDSSRSKQKKTKECSSREVCEIAPWDEERANRSLLRMMRKQPQRVEEGERDLKGKDSQTPRTKKTP